MGLSLRIAFAFDRPFKALPVPYECEPEGQLAFTELSYI